MTEPTIRQLRLALEAVQWSGSEEGDTCPYCRAAWTGPIADIHLAVHKPDCIVYLALSDVSGA